MPAPIKPLASSRKTTEDLTHKVTLLHGESYTLLDAKRPGSPWVFKNGVAVRVPAYVAIKLNESATESVTVKIGSKTTSQTQQKFSIEKLPSPNAPLEPAEKTGEEDEGE